MIYTRKHWSIHSFSHAFLSHQTLLKHVTTWAAEYLLRAFLIRIYFADYFPTIPDFDTKGHFQQYHILSQSSSIHYPKGKICCRSFTISKKRKNERYRGWGSERREPRLFAYWSIKKDVLQNYKFYFNCLPFNFQNFFGKRIYI